MNLSYKILSVFGINIELHLFFILFILAFALLSPQLALFLILIFFFVTLHELAHSVVAIHNKIRVRKIVLLPIGGMAMIEGGEIKPITEIKMSLAGPLLNIIFVYACLAIAYVFSLPLGDWLVQFLDPTQPLTLSPINMIFFYAFYSNLILGAFNLFLPAFPLDGGRIFRALLALKLDYVRASRIAKNLSLGIAGVLFLVAFIYSDLWIMVIAFFIAFGAVSEFEGMVAHRMLARIRMQDVLSKDFLLLDEKETIATALKKMVTARKMDALVATKTGVKTVSLPGMASMPKRKWNNSIGTVAKSAPHISVASPVEGAIKRMEQHRLSIVPVFSGNRLVGAIDRNDVEKAIRILDSLDRSS